MKTLHGDREHLGVEKSELETIMKTKKAALWKKNSEALVNYDLCFTASKANVSMEEFWGFIMKYFPQKPHVLQAQLPADEGPDFVTGLFQ